MELPAAGVADPFLTVPTGSRELHQSSGVVTFGGKVGVSKRWKYLHVGGHVGYRVKPGASTVGGTGADDELPFGLGVGASPLPDRLDINVEVVGAAILGAGREAAVSGADVGAVHLPMELLLSARLLTVIDIDVVAGGGIGLTPGVGNPVFRAFAGVSWSPQRPVIDLDRDNDGVPLGEDACVVSPEDLDGFEDEDDCPDPDDDGDGFPDADDPCPRNAEDFDGNLDSDGCPEFDDDNDGILDADDACPDEPEDGGGWGVDDGCPGTVEALVRDGRVWTARPIRLDDSGSALTPEARQMLIAVAAVLDRRDDIQLLRVEVWAPRRASAETSKAVAARLAREVLGALVEAGLDPALVESVEHDQPVAEAGGEVRLSVVQSSEN